jgi:arylsulfatase A-like enzyme
MNRLRLSFLAALSAASAFAQAKAPNFLFIAIDDLKPILGHLSEEPNNFLSEIYPDPAKRAAIRQVISPNLDRLAAQGVGFRHAYCPAPLCNPSRTATMTGIATHHSGVTANAEQFRQSAKPFLRDAVTLPQNLRQQGYYTAGTGKIFHTGSVQTDTDGKIVKDWPDQAHSWDIWVNGAGDGADRGRNTASPWSLPDDLFRFGVTTTATKSMDDYVKADLIARVLEQGRATVTDTKMKQEKTIALPSDRPWFLACGIFRPHLPFIVPQEFLDLFKADDIAITRAYYQANVADTRDLAPGGLKFTEQPRDDGEPGKGRFSDMLRQGKAREKDGDLKAWREMIRHYLAAVAFADRCVGRLLEALDRSPHQANTVVVLWSDHGWDLGVKFRAGKVALWESTTNCVMIIRDPQTPAAVRGTPSYARVGLQDLYPTIAARAGAKKPAYVAGRDLTPLLQNPSLPWNEVPITTQGARNHALRDANFRYIRYADDPANAELYDQQADPREHTNRIADPALMSVREAMNGQLDQRIQAGPFPYDLGKVGGPSADHEDAPARQRPANRKNNKG